jgi:hypothetical protein
MATRGADSAGEHYAVATRIIHECRREAFETEARRGFSQGARRDE